MIGELQSSQGQNQGHGNRNNYPHNRGGSRTGRGRGRNFRGGRGHGGHGRGGRGRGHGKSDDASSVYIPPLEWNAMTAQQRQAFLQARAASRISALTSVMTPSDDLSAITTPTNLPVQTQIAHTQQVGQVPTSSQQVAGSTGSAVSGPFGGRASQRG
jgi:hypothetical protein